MTLIHAGLLLSLVFSPAVPSRHAMAVSPYSWADDPGAWMEAPACLVRAEVWEVGAFGSVGNLESEADWTEDLSGTLAAVGPAGALCAGAALSGAGGQADTLGGGVAAALLLTGDPVSFMEGFFGPSVSVGAALAARRMSEGDGAGGELLVSGSAQVAFFPTFCIGLGARPSRVAAWGPDSLRSGDSYGGVGASCTYIFGRELRGHLGFGKGGASVGADLKVSDLLTVMAGTDGSFWGCGLSASSGRITADYGLSLTDASASHSAGLWLKLGEASW